MIKGYLHTKIDNKNLVLRYILALFPLLIYGSYKNIIVVYKRGLMSKNTVLINILIICITILVPIICDILYSIIKKEKIKTYLLNSYSLFYSLIYLLIMPTRYNIFIFILGLLLTQIISKINLKININLVCMIKLLIIILLVKNYSYANIYESTKHIYYNLFDSFFGRTVGSYGTTNIFLILLSYIFLCMLPHYKKEIPLISIISFTLFGILFYIITKSSGFNIAKDLINTNFIFCIVFISTISFYSPFTKEGSYIYATLVGILSFILIKVTGVNEGTLIAILILSIFNLLIDKLVLKFKNINFKNLIKTGK